MNFHKNLLFKVLKECLGDIVSIFLKKNCISVAQTQYQHP